MDTDVTDVTDLEALLRLAAERAIRYRVGVEDHPVAPSPDVERSLAAMIRIAQREAR